MKHSIEPMQIEIGQQRRDDPSLWRSLLRPAPLLPAAAAFTLGAFFLHHRSLQPHPDQLQYRPICYSIPHTGLQSVLRNRIEVPFQVRVIHRLIPGLHLPAYLLQRLVGRASRPEPIGAVFDTCFKDRLQNQQGRRLHHTISHRRYPQRPQLPIGFRYVDPSYRLRRIAVSTQQFLYVLQKSWYSLDGGLNLFDGHPIHARCALISSHLGPCVRQHIHPIDPVIQGIKPELRFLLGFVAQLLPQQRDFPRQPSVPARSPFFRSGSFFLQAVLLPSCSCLFPARPLRSLRITGLLRYYGPLRLPAQVSSRSHGFLQDERECRHPQPAGSPKFLSALSLRAVPFHPGKLHECFCLLLPHESQASSNSADWPLSLGVTRPDRVHLRYGSQVRRTRLRQKDRSSLRSFGYLSNRQLQGELLSVHKIR